MWSNTLNATLTLFRKIISRGTKKDLLLRVGQGMACFYTVSTILFSAEVCADIYFSSRTIGPSTNIYSVDSKGVIHRITDNELWKDAGASISQTGELVFMSNRQDQPKIDLHKQTEDFNIFKIDRKSGDLQQLTLTPHFEHSPAISNDGRWIVWLQKSGNYRKLMLLKNGDSTPTTIAIANDIYSVNWAPNNRVLAFTSMSEQKSQLYMYDINSKEKMLLLEVSTMPSTGETAPRKVFDAHYNTLLKPADITEGRIISEAQWSPDGKKIAWILAATTEQKRELHVLDLWSKSSTPVSRPTVQVQQPVSWSPDSKSVLYSALVNYNFYFDEKTQQKVYEGSMQIYLSDLRGEIKQLTEGEHMHNRPVFSPDGKSIAFLYGLNLGERTLALHTLSLQDKTRQEHYDRVAGDSFLYWY